METEFKPGECAQLKFGNNPHMNVVSVDTAFDGTIDVVCTWTEGGKNKWITFKAHTLKHCTDLKGDLLKGVIDQQQ